MASYKDTLNLPQTSFPMKADLPKREPGLLAEWEKEDIYSQVRKKRKKAPKYILHDGPPYANGDIHIGHALNKILKDIVVRFKTMQGYDSPFIPGWDCHGLPVEHQLFKELKITKHQIGQVEFRKKAYDYAAKYVNIQKEQFKRLGILGDWDNPYLTLDPGYESSIIRIFGKLVDAGFVYKGLKPVNWCATCETALAEAEVEYADHQSPSIFVKFKIIDSKLSTEGKPAYMVIWTTTPWTLVSNVAIAVHPELHYSLIQTDDEVLVMAKELTQRSAELMGMKDYKILQEVKVERLRLL